MAVRDQKLDVKEIIRPLRPYLNKKLPIDKDLLTDLKYNGLIASNSISQWMCLLDNGKENEARYALIDYLEKHYTYEYLVKFTDLLSELSKESKPKLGEVAKKLNIAMGRDPSQQESQPSVARLQQQVKDEPQQDGGLIDSTTDLQSYVDPMLPYLEQLGTALGVSDYASAVINGPGSPQAKCILILQTWLSRTPRRTWALFCEKLSKVLEFAALVDKIKRERNL